MSIQRQVATRRTATPLQPQRFFQMILNSPLHWPGKTVRLERNSAFDYRQRLTSNQVAVAELYHENSKIYPQILPELMATRVHLDELRREFISRRAIVVNARSSSEPFLSQRWRECLTEVRDTINLEVFYAVELLVAAGDLLAAYEPVSDLLHVVKKLQSADQDKLRDALALMDNRNEPVFRVPLLLILGSFARNDVLFGARGYRRTLLEAGQVAQEVIHRSERLDLEARPFYEFIDRDVDAVMEADGIELGTIMAFELRGGTDVS